MRIEVTEWKIKTEKDGTIKICGRYDVMCGTAKVASSEFNDGYGATTLNIPADVMVEALKFDATIKEAIQKNFTA